MQEPPLHHKLIGVAAICALVGLYGCATQPQPNPAVCLPLTPYTTAQQQQAASELSKLQGSEVAQMIVDYGRMRQADRACQGK